MRCNRAVMVEASVIKAFETNGFVALAGFLPSKDLHEALDDQETEFPSATDFHDDVDPTRNARFRDEFGGITNFPFASTALSLVAVHPQLIELAASLLKTEDVRVYSIEAWAKYTGAAHYDQHHHRDYLNHSLLAPAVEHAATQVEMFVYLNDVTGDLGPPSYVPRQLTDGAAALPNWYPRDDGAFDDEHPGWVCPRGRQDLYDAEVSAVGPAGTVVAYRIETFHRGTELRQPRGARYTLHLNFRRSDADWITRRAWTDVANTAAWHSFVVHASTRQLELFGFPPPGHPYWTDGTRDGLACRYPGLDTSHW